MCLHFELSIGHHGQSFSSHTSSPFAVCATFSFARTWSRLVWTLAHAVVSLSLMVVMIKEVHCSPISFVVWKNSCVEMTAAATSIDFECLFQFLGQEWVGLFSSAIGRFVELHTFPQSSHSWHSLDIMCFAIILFVWAPTMKLCPDGESCHLPLECFCDPMLIDAVIPWCVTPLQSIIVGGFFLRDMMIASFLFFLTQVSANVCCAHPTSSEISFNFFVANGGADSMIREHSTQSCQSTSQLLH